MRLMDIPRLVADRLRARERPDNLLVAEHSRRTVSKQALVSDSSLVVAVLDKQGQLLEDIDLQEGNWGNQADYQGMLDMPVLGLLGIQCRP